MPMSLAIMTEISMNKKVRKMWITTKNAQLFTLIS